MCLAGIVSPHPCPDKAGIHGGNTSSDDWSLLAHSLHPAHPTLRCLERWGDVGVLLRLVATSYNCATGEGHVEGTGDDVTCIDVESATTPLTSVF